MWFRFLTNLSGSWEAYILHPCITHTVTATLELDSSAGKRSGLFFQRTSVWLACKHCDTKIHTEGEDRMPYLLADRVSAAFPLFCPSGIVFTSTSVELCEHELPPGQAPGLLASVQWRTGLHNLPVVSRRLSRASLTSPSPVRTRGHRDGRRRA